METRKKGEKTRPPFANYRKLHNGLEKIQCTNDISSQKTKNVYGLKKFGGCMKIECMEEPRKIANDKYSVSDKDSTQLMGMMSLFDPRTGFIVLLVHFNHVYSYRHKYTTINA